MENPFDPSKSDAIAKRAIEVQATSALFKGASYSTFLGILGAIPVVVMLLSGRPGMELPLVFSLTGASVSLVAAVLAKQGLV